MSANTLPPTDATPAAGPRRPGQPAQAVPAPRLTQTGPPRSGAAPSAAIPAAGHRPQAPPAGGYRPPAGSASTQPVAGAPAAPAPVEIPSPALFQPPKPPQAGLQGPVLGPGVSIETFFDQVIAASVKHAASDIHITAGCPVKFRVSERIENLGSQALKAEETRAIALHILTRAGRVRSKNEDQIDELMLDADCSYGVSGVGRFRVNVCNQRGSVALVMRRIPFVIPTTEELKLPPVVRQIAMEPRGLVLVTGMTGSGKSTTLAAMIDLINVTKQCKIVTIEDPIEFLFRDKKASIIQREVGSDTRSFAAALRSSLRQNPDVILVGEMRDEETVEIALKAAETGHLVLSTLHTTDAAKTINRLISFVTPEEQAFLRIRLSDSLRAIISQRLLPRIDGRGLIAAVEVLRSTTSIKECVANPEKTINICDFIKRGRDQYGMQTFDQHVMDLVQQGIVSKETGKEAATSAADFERNLVFE